MPIGTFLLRAMDIPLNPKKVISDKERVRLEEYYSFERSLYAQGADLVVGVDEVGRGPLAGPVTVCAAILNPAELIEGVNDSKKVAAKKRETVARAIRLSSTAYSLAHVEANEIDQIGIMASLRKAAHSALAQLPLTSKSIILVDGNGMNLGLGERNIIKGDGVVACIGAASILAKVSRDSLMVEYDQMYPEYGFASNKGYGSAQHIGTIRQKGLTPLHRVTFCTRFTSM